MITFAKRDEIGPIFAKKVRNLVPLKKIYLFGSTSRKKDRIDSDIDIALVGNAIPIIQTIKKEGVLLWASEKT